MIIETETPSSTTVAARPFLLVTIAGSLAAWEIGFEYGAFETVSYRRVFAVFIVSSVVLIATMVADDDTFATSAASRVILGLPLLYLLADITFLTNSQTVTDVLGVAVHSSNGNETLAFVNTVDDDGSGFQMSINLNAYDADPNEAALTVAHEFSHVFTSTETQLDRSVTSAEDCNTYYNTEGCFLPDSVMAQWIALFWGDGLIDQIDVTADPNPEDGDARCASDDRFLGAYAASNPEEDFGETFSAFVFQVTPVSKGVQLKFDWLADQPGLVEFQERAAKAGLGPIANDFERCGN